MMDPVMKDHPLLDSAEATRPAQKRSTREHSEREKARHALAARAEEEEKEKQRQQQAEKKSGEDEGTKPRQQKLDKELEQSMDASDPPARLQP